MQPFQNINLIIVDPSNLRLFAPNASVSPGLQTLYTSQRIYWQCEDPTTAMHLAGAGRPTTFPQVSSWLKRAVAGPGAASLWHHAGLSALGLAAVVVGGMTLLISAAIFSLLRPVNARRSPHQEAAEARVRNQSK